MPSYNEIDDLIKGFEAEFKGKGNSPVIWASKSPRLVVKLMLEGERNWKNFFQPFDQYYEGEKKGTQFLVPVIVLESDNKEFEDKDSVKYLRVPKSVVLDIWKMFQNEYDPFSNPGDLVVVTNKKGQRSVEYKVGPLGKRQHDGSSAEWPEITLVAAAEQQSTVGREEKEDSKPTKKLPFQE